MKIIWDNCISIIIINELICIIQITLYIYINLIYAWYFKNMDLSSTYIDKYVIYL